MKKNLISTFVRLGFILEYTQSLLEYANTHSLLGFVCSTTCFEADQVTL